MKNKSILQITLFLTVCMFHITSVAQSNDEREFFYLYNKKCFIEKIPGTYVIKYKDNIKEQTQFSKSEHTLKKKLDLKTGVFENHTSSLMSLKSEETESVQPLYKYSLASNDTDYMYMSGEVILRPYKDMEGRVDRLLKKLPVSGIDKNEMFWTLTLKSNSDCIAIANKIQESGLTEYSYPNRYITLVPHYTPPDPFFNKQFYLNNTGQIINYGLSGTTDADIDMPEAWDITLGDTSIVVAVVDEGVTSNHPDLPSSRQRRILSSNRCYGTWVEYNAMVGGTFGHDPTQPTWEDPNDPAPNLFLNANHGNASAGIIAASHNNQGVSGICPNCKIMPIKIPFGNNIVNSVSLTENVAAQMLGIWNQGAHVISCSWGVEGKTNPDGSFPTMGTAITNAVTQGRNHRGSVVVFSAGNASSAVAYPANLNGIPGLISVGASDRNDVKATYSNTGANLDVVAPSHKEYLSSVGMGLEVWTMDIPGANGYNPWNHQSGVADGGTIGFSTPTSGLNYNYYTGWFGGTSASAPQVAGVAALMISMNPCLTAQEVETIIKRNADRLSGYSYNGVGHSDDVGFGRLNAVRCLTDEVYEQNKYYTGVYSVKGGTVRAGNNVTASISTGTVTANDSHADVLYLGSYGVTLEEGFTADGINGGTFRAMVSDPKNDSCRGWDGISMSYLGNSGKILKDPELKLKAGVKDDRTNVSKEVLTQEVETGIEEKSLLNIVRIYPNPNSTKTLTIELNNSSAEKVKMNLYNSVGTLIESKTFNTATVSENIDLNGLKAGIYPLIVTYRGQTITRKIIIY